MILLFTQIGKAETLQTFTKNGKGQNCIINLQTFAKIRREKTTFEINIMIKKYLLNLINYWLIIWKGRNIEKWERENWTLKFKISICKIILGDELHFWNCVGDVFAEIFSVLAMLLRTPFCSTWEQNNMSDSRELAHYLILDLKQYWEACCEKNKILQRANWTPDIEMRRVELI